MICWGRNQKGEIYFLLNFGCLKCWVIFGNIEYNIYFFFYDAKGEKDMTFFNLLVNYHKMCMYIDCLIILKWQIDLCIKIGGDLKISNIKIYIILGGAFQEKLQNHKLYKNIISYVSSSKRERLLASRFQYLLIG